MKNAHESGGKKAPSPATAVAADKNARELRQKAEQAEVAGRHRNDGQKDHKGAR